MDKFAVVVAMGEYTLTHTGGELGEVRLRDEWLDYVIVRDDTTVTDLVAGLREAIVKDKETR